ncbi:RNA polymerase sigma factor [Terrimonas rubra]|uniref:RNA polymerase sigma factor n=1 Tax=Terrimonas rubra TaxID=1035890 RepID=A0ABW6AAJ5_9BACT
MTEKLIAQFNKGRSEAFTLIYRKFQPKVFFLVQQYIADTAQAEDIVTETFLKLWNNRSYLDTEKRISGFLHVAARNACIDNLRASKKETQKLQELLRIQQEDFRENSYDEIKAEVISLIHKEIDALPPKIKEVFKLAYIDGMSNEAIAALLGIRNQSVRNHKTRAVALLKLSLSGKKDLLLLFFLIAEYKIA